MLRRSYSEVYRNNYPTYVDVTVCKEWLTFSTFREWMEQQDWRGKQLDKDILVPHNKIYSPENCIFVSQKINSFFTDRAACRGEWPIGVVFIKSLNKFQAGVNRGDGKYLYLGVFNDPETAHMAWKSAKHKLAVEIANSLDEVKDERLRYALLTRFI